MSFYEWLLKEEIIQQKERIINILQQKYPNQNDLFYEKTFNILQQKENELTDIEDKRKSLTINKYLKKLNYPINNHFFDRINQELTIIVNRNNLNKSTNKLETIVQQLRAKLPSASEEDLKILANNILQDNQNIDLVIKKYLSSKPKSNNNKIIFTDKQFKIIEVKDWEGCGDFGDIDESEHCLFTGTAWCVRKFNYFRNYTANGPLYLIQINNKPFALGHKESKILDIHDDNLTKEKQDLILPIIIKSKIYDLLKGLDFDLIQNKNLKNDIIDILFEDKQKIGEALGIDPEQFGYQTIIIDEFDGGLDDLYDKISFRSNHKLQNFKGIEDFSVDSSIKDTEIKDCIYYLNKENKDKLENYFNDNLEKEEYDFDDEILENEDIKEAFIRAIYSAIESGSQSAAYKDVVKQLSSSTDNGFYIDFKNNHICISTNALKYLYAKNIDDFDNGESLSYFYDFEFSFAYHGYYDFCKETFNDILDEELDRII